MEKVFQELAEVMFQEIDLCMEEFGEFSSSENFRSLEDFERAEKVLRVLAEIVRKYTEKARRLAE